MGQHFRELGGFIMVAELQLVLRFDPDALEIPGDPERLRGGAEKLQDFITGLTDVGQRLREADAPKESRGPTVRAMSRVAGTVGRVLEADAEQLSDVAELVRRQADRLTDAQGTVDEARRRWRQARDELRDQVDDLNERVARAERERNERIEREEREEKARKDGKNGGHGGGGDRDRERRDPEPPTEAAQLIRAMDQQVLNQVDGPLRRLAGLEFTDRHGAVAMAMDGKVDQIAERYRQSVQAIFDDVVEALRQVHRVDEQLVEQLPRREKALASVAQAPDQQAAPDLTRVSRPEDLTTVGEQLQECAQALNRADEQLPEIRIAIREGRMTPEDERIGSMSGFQRTWKEHLDQVREDLNHARKAGEEIARELRELDERGAREVRRAFRQAD
ncbi:hypothetical protein SAMN06295964_2838 [Aeromicrobium choanae]|uniref:Putative T7SS secretion signal domain-containing protein n=2 Tax=Aeromicrobium choanae TaxID=1736691 RepID=A0A1T4Z820_9ACTN|nr:hypothetical protein SAMN06295964_2838 [Aeromicrobium choanae]